MVESDEHFLRFVTQALERLRQASQERGHPMLASIIALAQTEADDDLRTQALSLKMFSEFQETSLTGGARPNFN